MKYLVILIFLISSCSYTSNNMSEDKRYREVIKFYQKEHYGISNDSLYFKR